MSGITLAVLQGLERGNRFADLPVPVTIGREEENTIQLNDERISRCHVKIQRSGDRIILTDLESTNGTRVNGLPVKLAVLRPGDLISLGRCVLLYGSRDEIFSHCHELHRKSLETQWKLATAEASAAPNDVGTGSLLFDEHGQPTFPFPGGRPPLPRLKSLQSRSELADLLAYIHAQILQVLEARNPDVAVDSASGEIPVAEMAQIPWPLWYLLVDLETDMAQYLKEIPEPE